MGKGKGGKCFNRVELIGYLGGDPEFNHIQNDSKVANFFLATSESFKKKSGEIVERVEWHRITAWGKLAEISNKYLRKGSRVFVEGKLSTSTWEDEEGVKRYSTDIIVKNLIMLGDPVLSD